MFEKLFANKEEPPRPRDPDFGALVSSPGKFPGQVRWIGIGAFPPTGTEITYQLGGVPKGPTDGHRAAFHAIVEHYAEFYATALPVLAEQLKANLGTLEPRDLKDLFVPVSLWVPDEEVGPDMEWDMSFRCDAAGKTYSVDFKCWEAVSAEEE
ncbi:MAG: hypothetical protein ABJD11_12870 [Gemmatimonadota bacterium]